PRSLRDRASAGSRRADDSPRRAVRAPGPLGGRRRRRHASREHRRHGQARRGHRLPVRGLFGGGVLTARRALASLAAAVVGVAVTGPPAHADGALASYRVVAQAAGFNWTYDSPTSNFHPQPDNELPYAEIDGDPTRAHAISSLYWPGAAGGNLGSLIAVLGGPSVASLNDPVRAEASSAATNQQATATPTGTAMTASVVPGPDATQEASATASWAGAQLGSGSSVGAISAVAKPTLGKDGKLRP